MYNRIYSYYYLYSLYFILAKFVLLASYTHNITIVIYINIKDFTLSYMELYMSTIFLYYTDN